MEKYSIKPSKYQFEILEELTKVNTEEKVRLSDFSPLIFFFLFQAFIDDWKHYTMLEKIAFLGIWSPLLWFPLALLMEV